LFRLQRRGKLANVRPEQFLINLKKERSCLVSDRTEASNKIGDMVLSRRSFMKWSAALGGALAVSGNLAFGLKKAAGSMTSNSMSYEGKWIPSDCWADCGSKGFNKAYVVDGIVVKMGTDDTIPDSFDCPQLRSCARGRSQRLHILGADRLK